MSIYARSAFQVFRPIYMIDRTLNSEIPPWAFEKPYGTIYQPLRSGRIWHKVNF